MKVYSDVGKMFEEMEEERRKRPLIKKIYHYIWYRLILNFWDEIKPMMLVRKCKWIYQYFKYGFSNKQLWSLDFTITKFILPRLIRFKETKGEGFPCCLDTYTFNIDPDIMSEQEEKEFCQKNLDEWNKILDKMILAFQLLHDDKWKKIEEYDQQQERIKEGLELFIKYYQNLWD